MDRVRRRPRTTPTDLDRLFRAWASRRPAGTAPRTVTRYTPGRDQPGPQHRARGLRALAPDRARPLGGGDRPAGRRRRRRARARRGAALTAFRQPVGPGELDIPAIRGVGGSLIYFTRPRRRPRPRLGDRVRADRGRGRRAPPDPDRPHRPVDAARGAAELAALLPVALRPRDDAAGRRGRPRRHRREPWRCRTADRSVRFCLNASASRPDPGGALPRRVLRRRRAAHRLRHRRHLRRGRARCAPPGSSCCRSRRTTTTTSRRGFGARPGDGRPAARARHPLRRGRARPLLPALHPGLRSERFFFEIVQRDGYAGFGAPNAPIRLAAQARLARGKAMPRTPAG